VWQVILTVFAVVIVLFVASHWPATSTFVKDYGLVLSALVAVIGWQVNHRQAVLREQEASKRRKVSDELAQAFGALYVSVSELANGKDDCQGNLYESLGHAMAKLYLFGDGKIYKKACDIRRLLEPVLRDSSKEEVAKEINGLLQEIAKCLRKEMALQQPESPVDCEACFSNQRK
jgi:hypothetical protein